MRRPAAVITVALGFGILYLTANATLGTPPDAGTPTRGASTWIATHGGDIRTWLWLLTLSMPLFAGYASMIRWILPHPYRDLFFAGAVAFIVETSVQGWIWGALALRPATQSSAATAALLDAASFWGPVLTSTTIMMLAPFAILGLSPTHWWPRWHGYLAGIAAVEQLVETLTIFGRHGFIAPGGPMNLYLGAGLTALALIGAAPVAAQGWQAASSLDREVPSLAV
jgi:hypothetical protein